jgi:hypothetical protein
MTPWTGHRRRVFWMAACVLMLLGFALRVLGAQGELWLDEIHSLKLVSSIHSPDEVIWGINHANNHMLNSLWVYAVGPDSPPLRLRLLSIVLGTLSVLWAGLAAGRRHLSTALLAMAFFAVSFPMVTYGSEERGYSGLILFTLMAIHALRDRAPSWGDRLYLGLALVLGVLSHLTMIGAIVALFAWQMWIDVRSGEPVDAALGANLRRFLPGFAGIGMLAIAISVGSHIRPFIIPVEDPFTVYGTTTAYGLMLGSLAGVWYQPLGQTCLATALLFLAWQAFARYRDDRDGIGLYLFLVVLVPGILFATRGHNLNNVRFYLAFGAVYLLFLADMAGRGWRRGGAARILTVGLLTVAMGLTGYDLSQFYRTGRGHYAEAVAMMTGNGPATYGDDGGPGGDFGFRTVAAYYAARQHVDLSLVPLDKWCETPPQWLVVHTYQGEVAPARLTMGRPRCALHYDAPVIFPFWGMSGWGWTVYRLDAG